MTVLLEPTGLPVMGLNEQPTVIMLAVSVGSPGAEGPPGSGALPNGGSTGEVLVKQSNADQDADWGDYTAIAGLVTALANAGLTQEQIEDIVGAMVSGNTETGISITYDDASGKLNAAVTYGTGANTAAQGDDARLSDSRPPTGAAGGGLSGTYPNPTLSSEAVQDIVAALLVEGAGIDLTYDDTANTLTIAATGGGSSFPTYTDLTTSPPTGQANGESWAPSNQPNKLLRWWAGQSAWVSSVVALDADGSTAYAGVEAFRDLTLNLFSGTAVVSLLEGQGFVFGGSGGPSLWFVDIDPSVVGWAAEPGSVLLSRIDGGNGSVWGKTGGNNTDWTDLAGGGSSVTPSDADPIDVGTTDPGTSDDYSRGDHSHAGATVAQGALADSAMQPGDPLPAADLTGTIDDARIPSGVARDSEVTSAIATHAGAADPHGDRAHSDAGDAVLQSEVDAVLAQQVIDEGLINANTTAITGKQAASARLTEIAALNTNNTILSQVGGVWVARSWAAVLADIAAASSARQIIAGTGLTGGGDLTADRTLTVAYGTTAGTAAVGNDSRLSDSRTPSGSAGGDLTGTYPNPTIGTDKVVTAKILDANVTLAKLANMATASLLGRNTAGTGVPEVLSAATVRTLLGLVAIATSGSASDLSAGTVPTARLGSGTANSTTYLRGDNTWATVGGGGTVDVVSNVATSTILGRVTAGSGDSEELTASQVRTLAALVPGTDVASEASRAKVLYHQGLGSNQSLIVGDLSLYTAAPTVTAVAGELIMGVIAWRLLQNSGSSRSFTLKLKVGATVLSFLSGTVAASATDVQNDFQFFINVESGTSWTAWGKWLRGNTAITAGQVLGTDNIGTGITVDLAWAATAANATQEVQTQACSIVRFRT